MQAHDARLLRGSVVPTAAVGVVASLTGLAVAGSKGLIGGAFATVVVLVFFSAGLLAIGKITKGHPIMIMNLGMFTYLIQVIALGMVLWAFKGTTAFSTKTFAFTILAGAITWVISQVYTFSRLRIAYVEPEPSSTDDASRVREPAGERER